MTMPTTAPPIFLGLLGLIGIACLTRIFFLPGRWNVQWWLNTAPFVAGGVAMLAVLGGGLTPWVSPASMLGGAMAVLATVLIGAALCLTGYTLGTHRRPLALWHQTDDAPEHLVTEGPYARIRHPFYASYLLALVGCTLAAPHWSTLGVLAFLVYRLNRTAAREERRFLASVSFGAAYAAYMRGTGRFVPRLHDIATVFDRIERQAGAGPVPR